MEQLSFLPSFQSFFYKGIHALDPNALGKILRSFESIVPSYIELQSW
jgi:hypothetical protein